MIPNYSSLFNLLRIKKPILRRIFPFNDDKIYFSTKKELDILYSEVRDFDKIQEYLLKYLEAIKKSESLILSLNQSIKIAKKERKKYLERKYLNLLQTCINEKYGVEQRLKKEYEQEKKHVLFERNFWDQQWDSEFVDKHVLTINEINSVFNTIKNSLQNINNNQEQQILKTKNLITEIDNYYYDSKNLEDKSKEQLIEKTILDILRLIEQEKKEIKTLYDAEQFIVIKILPQKQMVHDLHKEHIKNKQIYAVIKKFENEIDSKFSEYTNNFKNILKRIIFFQQDTHLLYRCSYPKKDYFNSLITSNNFCTEKFESLIRELDDNEITQKSSNLLNKKRQMYSLINLSKQLSVELRNLDELIKKFTQLSQDPIANRNEILQTKAEISQLTLQKIPEIFTKDLLQAISGTRSMPYGNLFFNNMTRYGCDIYGRDMSKKIYYGINVLKQEMILSNNALRDKEKVKNPEEYAQTIFDILINGIIPSRNDKNYLSCSELPAVFFYSVPGKWIGHAYIELDTSDYPVFEDENIGPQKMRELIIYTIYKLILKNFRLIFHPCNTNLKNINKTLMSDKVRLEMTYLVIKNLYGLIKGTDLARNIKVCMSNNLNQNYSFEEFYNLIFKN